MLLLICGLLIIMTMLFFFTSKRDTLLPEGFIKKSDYMKRFKEKFKRIAACAKQIRNGEFTNLEDCIKEKSNSNRIHRHGPLPLNAFNRRRSTLNRNGSFRRPNRTNRKTALQRHNRMHRHINTMLLKQMHHLRNKNDTMDKNQRNTENIKTNSDKIADLEYKLNAVLNEDDVVHEHPILHYDF